VWPRADPSSSTPFSSAPDLIENLKRTNERKIEMIQRKWNEACARDDDRARCGGSDRRSVSRRKILSVENTGTVSSTVSRGRQSESPENPRREVGEVDKRGSGNACSGS
jgi:hypothetical protein